jgi:predicted phosphodiesterase
VRFLCLSDVHGHADALGAVLATAERRGYDGLLVAGDLCFPGPEPLATWRRLAQLGAVCVQGVGDRALATLDPAELHPRDAFERTRLERLRAVREELGPTVLRQLAELPPMVRLPLGGGREILLVHGSPRDPLEPLTHDTSDEVLAELLGEEPAEIVLCGGSHVAFDRRVPRPAGATRVVNLGSVGEAPGEGGVGGFAHATFVEIEGGGIEIEQFIVPLGRPVMAVGASAG